MVDVDSLQELLAKAQAKAKRLRAQADSAETEAAEIETAIRVIERVTGAAAATADPTGTAVGGSSSLILSYVGFGEAAGKSPKEIHDVLSLIEDGDMSADLVRTQLWRMAKRKILHSKDGRYWRPENEEAPVFTGASDRAGLATGRGTGFPSTPPAGSIPPSSTNVPDGFDADLDDDVPF